MNYKTILTKLGFYDTYQHLSFPKSGRTWVQYMLSSISSQETGKEINAVLESNAPTFQKTAPARKRVQVQFSHGVDNYDLCRDGSFRKDIYTGKQAILLFRNPRDVLISYYYHEKWRSKNFSGSLSDFIRCDDQNAPEHEKHKLRWGIRPIVNYYNTLYREKDCFKKHKIFFYEEFREEPEENLRALLDFCNISCSEDRLQYALESGQFKNMKKMEQKGEISYYGLKKAEDQRGSKVRKAKVNSYKEEMEQDDIDFCNQYLTQHLDDFFARYKTT